VIHAVQRRTQRPLPRGVTDVTRVETDPPLNFTAGARYIHNMRVLCIGRHPFLSEHLCRFFGELGLDTVPCVGIAEAVGAVVLHEPDAIICDYDLLATMSLVSWEDNPTLSSVPVIAVSLTRHPGEAHLLDVNGIDGFLYLPTLEQADAQRLLAAIRPRRTEINPPHGLPWSETTPLAQLH
jgi:hypothetical protein